MTEQPLNILWSIKDYVPKHNAGDTLTAHAVNKYLVSKGHNVKVMLGMLGQRYEIDGVQVGPRDQMLVQWADLVITHLDFTAPTVAMVRDICPMFHYTHNSFDYPTVRLNRHHYVIHNSEWVKQALNYQNECFVLPPPIDINFYNVERPGAEYITLINNHKGKGSEIFYQLADHFPERKFLSVAGSYGQQDVRELPNVTHWKNQPDAREIYKVTRLLLMPSMYESFGRTAGEAICSGIPVLCTSMPGLKENLSYAGVYCDNLSNFIDNIMKLDGKREYENASEVAKKRSIELNPISKLEKFEAWVKKKVAEHRKKREIK